MVFLFALAIYLAGAVLLDFHYLSFNWDSASRMANGFYVLYSRDPHLAAVGFVWNPGTSIAELVPLLFYHLWSPIVTHVFAAGIVSAAATAGAVYQIRCTLAEWGVSRAPRLVLVSFFALNGMILYYGSNGMSEGLYLFTLIATCRYLLRWLRQDDIASLVYAAIALGACYLMREEAAMAALFSGSMVLVVAYLRGRQVRPRPVWAALTDFSIFELPFAISLIGWATVSYVITGNAIQRVTLVSSTAGASVRFPIGVQLHVGLRDLIYLAPTIPFVLVIAGFVAVRRRDVGLLAPLSVLGGGIAFSLLALIGNGIPGYFRYFIVVVPLGTLVVGSLFASDAASIDSRLRSESIEGRAGRRRGLSSVLAVFVAVALMAPSAVSTVRGMFNPKVGAEESEFLGFIFHEHPNAADAGYRSQYAGVTALSSYFERMKLTDGQVIVDNDSNCVSFMYVTSKNPKVFVIPNDRDFQKTLADPLTFHAHYILDVLPEGLGALTIMNGTYPSLWNTGGGFAQEIHAFPAKGVCSEFKLFRVTGHPGH